MMTNPSEQPVPSSIVEMSDHTGPLGQQVYNMLPDDCEKIEFTADLTATVGQTSALVYRGGSPFSFTTYDHGIINSLPPLRSLMYKPGGGTWYSMVITITNEGKADFRFDYEHEPVWLSPVDPSIWAKDQAAFPRDYENQPEWLRERLAQAGA